MARMLYGSWTLLLVFRVLNCFCDQTEVTFEMQDKAQTLSCICLLFYVASEARLSAIGLCVVVLLYMLLCGVLSSSTLSFLVCGVTWQRHDE